MARMTNPSFSVYRATAPDRQQLLVQWYENGKRHKRKLGTYPSKRAARDAGNDWVAEVVRGDLVPVNGWTADSWLDRWLELCVLGGLRERTIYDYRNKLALYVRPTIGDLPLDALEPTHLDVIYTAMANRGLSARTIRYTHSVIRKALADAVRKNLLVLNVADRATPPRASAAKAAERRVWTPAELRTFLDGVADEQHRVALHTIAMSGMRRSEALALTWSALDLDRGVIEVRVGLTQTGTELHINAPKTDRRRRRIDIDDETVSLLRRHRRQQLEDKMLVGVGYRDHDLVFARPDGEPWKPDSITAAFRRRVGVLGLPKVTLHDLRHGHASYMLATTTDVNTVSDRLGHATAGFTLSTYGHSLPGRQAEAVRRVADLIGPPS